MRQRLLAFTLILGMLCVGPVVAGEVISPANYHGWLASIWEDVVSFFVGVNKDGDIYPNHEISIPPAGFTGDVDPTQGELEPAIDLGDPEHGPYIEPGG